LWKILLCAPPCRPYNIGSEDARTIEDIARCVAVVSGNISVKIRERQTKGQLTTRYVPDISRAGRELGLRVQTDLDKSIRRTLEFYRQSSRYRAGGGIS